MSYQDIYTRSLEDPEGFWAEAAKDIDWYKPAEKILDDSNIPFYRWFQGGELNTCYNALDRHVENGRGDQAALIYDSPVTGTKKTYYLYRTERHRRQLRRCTGRSRRGERRSGHRLYADDSRSCDCHAGMRPHRCNPLGGIRRICRQRAGYPHKRCQA